MADPEETFSYVDIVCEAKLNPTEKRETIEELLKKFLSGDVVEDIRSDGTYLLIRGNDISDLLVLYEWSYELKLMDTVRTRLIKSILGNITALYFNRQAVAMDKLALVDVDDSPPLGSIVIQIISDNLMAVINQIAPKTYDGKILSEEQILKREQKRAMRKYKKEGKQSRDRSKSRKL